MKKAADPAPADKPATAPDPQRLRAALAKAEAAKADLADFKEVTIPKWRAEYDELVRTGDPHDPIHLRDAAHARERAEIAINYLRRFERELTPVMNAALRAVQDFDRAFLAAADAEYDALLLEVAAVVAPYCRDVEQATQAVGSQMVDAKGVPLASQGIDRIMVSTASNVARGCTVFSYIPRSPDTLAAHFDPDYAHSLAQGGDHLAWREVPSFEEAAVAAGFAPDGTAIPRQTAGLLGGSMPALATAGNVNHAAHSPMAGETFRSQLPQVASLAVQANATFQRVVWGRAAALLQRHDEWLANGSRFVPQNFADLGPLLLGEAAAPVVPGTALANLGGTGKDMRAYGGHGVPAVDLQNVKL